jgi:putative ABC transport system substrate-binding protein
MKIMRREFITLLGGAAAAWPLAAGAQQPTMPVIGHLSAGLAQLPPGDPFGAAFRKGLSEIGYVEGRNVAIESRSAQGRYDRLPALAADLVQRKVAVIYATGAANSAQAAKAATTTIPIVFQNGSDPIKVGLVPSLNRPGGNATGVVYFISTLVAKRLEMLRELVPQARLIGFLTNPKNSISDITDLQANARSVGQEITVLTAGTADEIGNAFATAAQRSIGALLVDGDPLFNSRRIQFAVLAAHHRIPTSYPARVFPEAGGLMSYSDDRLESARLAGTYVGRILKGEKPADLPVLQPTKFDLVINLATAKTLGLTVPPTLLVQATELIE